MANSMFLNYGTSYFDLLSQRIDDNEAEITDIDFAKLDKPDPIVQNGLLYITDLTGTVASSNVLCQDNNALQNVQCVQIPASASNPASTIPELAGQEDTTVWISSSNGHLYRGSVDLESGGGGGGGNVTSLSSSSVLGAIPAFSGTTARNVVASDIFITSNDRIENVRSYGFNAVPTNPGGNVLWFDSGAFKLKFNNDVVGNVEGGLASTDNAIARFDGTTGKVIQGSSIILADDNSVEFPSLTSSPLKQGGQVLLRSIQASRMLGLGRTMSNPSNILVGFPPTGNAYSATSSIVIGHDSCGANDTGVVDNLIIGHDAGYLSGDKTISIGNRPVGLPNPTSGLGAGNLLMGFDIIVNNDASDNIALATNTNLTGSRNIYLGNFCNGNASVGSDNVFIGYEAHTTNVFAANSNVLIGSRVLTSASGVSSNNVMIGADAGSAITSGSLGNIFIANSGVNGDNQTIRLGSSQTNCYVKGIAGSSVGSSSYCVRTDLDGKLFNSISARPCAYLSRVSVFSTTLTTSYTEVVVATTLENFADTTVFTSNGTGRLTYAGLFPGILAQAKIRCRLVVNHDGGSVAGTIDFKMGVNGALSAHSTKSNSVSTHISTTVFEDYFNVSANGYVSVFVKHDVGATLNIYNLQLFAEIVA